MRSHQQLLSRGASAVIAMALAVLVGTNLATSGASASRSWWEPVDRPSPDSDVNVAGAPFTGTNAKGEVRGFADLHNHLMTNEGFGGRIICGKPYSEAGVADALKDCPEHYPNGLGALFEQVTGGGLTHDPNGWPTFKDWPRSNSMTHQQNYYAWIERAWRGGLRVLVSDLTSNGPLCAIYPYKDRGCDEMESIRLQAAKTYQMQAFIDQMYGGEGQGWFRIVKTATEARNVAKQGKLAVVLGVETSEPFGCKQILDIAQCSKGDIDRGLDELYGLGVRSMFVCHKYDNALCGVRFDSGTNGIVVNAGQFLSTGTFWKTERCQGTQQDNPIGIEGVLPDWAKLPVAMPTYSADAKCNTRGLTRLGEYAVRGLMQRGMMIEVDHMSVKAANRTFEILESADYPGVISSHSWMDASWRERAYQLGGVIATYGFNGQPFIDESRQGAALRAKYDRGLPFGADMNGVGGRPAPRGTGAGNQVTYPFTSVDGGSTIDKQVSGERTWDVNADGAAHYGMLPDAVEELRKLGGQDVVNEMYRGAETYLDTWAATEQHQSQARPNLASGMPAAASSSEWNPFISYAPGRALDGDVGSRWASHWSDDQWLRVDLGTARTVGRVVTDWEAAHARSYRIEVSTDGSTWRSVWSTDAGNGGIDTAKFTPTSARYVRVHGTARATSYGYSLWEVGVYDR